jgi:hypothetical protein
MQIYINNLEVYSIYPSLHIVHNRNVFLRPTSLCNDRTRVAQSVEHSLPER